MFSLLPKAKAALLLPLSLWGLQMILGAMVLLVAFVFLPSSLANQAQLSRQMELQELANRMIVNSRSMADEQSLDMLSVLNDTIEQHSLIHPETNLSIDNRPIQEVGILGVAENNSNNGLKGQVQFTDHENVQHTLYFQEARAEQQPGLPLHLLQIGLLLFYATGALTLPWVLRGRTSTKYVTTQQVQSDQKASVTLPKAENDGLPLGVVGLDSSGSMETANGSDYRRLVAKTNLLHQVTDALPCAIIAIDRHSRVIALNDTASIIFDVDKSKCLGRVLASSLAQMLPSLANHEEAVGLKLRLGDGTEDAQYDIRTRHLRDFHGRMQGTVCIISDKSTELSLAEQVKRNERLAVIGQMAAGTVHEIRNPLAAVRGFAQLLAQGSEGGKAREYSELTMLEIDRIDQIFSEFLLLSRAVEPDMVPVELSGVLQAVLQLLQALFEQRHIRLHIDRWQAAQVLGDAHYLQHVFLHLLYNALDATPAGGSISIELARLGEVVSVTISDTGKGMDEAALNRCFDPFFTTKETGTGLGLTICQRLLDQMNGFIKIESLPGAGTTVMLSFPLAMENAV